MRFCRFSISRKEKCIYTFHAMTRWSPPQDNIPSRPWSTILCKNKWHKSIKEYSNKNQEGECSIEVSYCVTAQVNSCWFNHCVYWPWQQDINNKGQTAVYDLDFSLSKCGNKILNEVFFTTIDTHQQTKSYVRLQF